MTELPSAPGSLCETCVHRREVFTAKNTRFLRCLLFPSDARFPKYPPQPVIRCGGWLEDQRGVGRERKDS
ncbi:MAG: hypothetical protein VYE81_06170 [Planctomycetota bacterium]|nr:hypothetical protein [Planctomycetota bacterium]